MSALPKCGSFDSLTVNEREVGGPDRRTVMLPSSTFGVAPSPPFEGAPPPSTTNTTNTNRTSSELAGAVGSMGAVLPARLSSGSQGGTGSGSQGAQAGMLSAQSTQASVEGGRRSHGESLSATDNSFGPQSLQSPQSLPLDTRPSHQRSVSQLPQMTSSSSLGNLAGGTTPITDFPW